MSTITPMLGYCQGTLGGAGTPAIHGQERPQHERTVHLDSQSWVAHHPGWLAGSDRLLDALVARLPFATFSRSMYDRMVEVPRLSWFGTATDTLLPPIVGAIAAELETSYGGDFGALGANLYRDGADSVAWHSDRIGRAIRWPLVALVSLGEHRPFLVRPKGGGPSQRFLLGGGDLLVMGGAMQHRFEHCVPKVARSGPRLSLGFRDPAGIPTTR